jgi:hypothetical protein
MLRPWVITSRQHVPDLHPETIVVLAGIDDVHRICVLCVGLGQLGEHATTLPAWFVGPWYVRVRWSEVLCPDWPEEVSEVRFTFGVFLQAFKKRPQVRTDLILAVLPPGPILPCNPKVGVKLCTVAS